MNKNVLFVCVHNSARSQMAEEYVKLLSDGGISAESAGFEPGTINPIVIQAMKEDGVDLSNKETKSVFELFRKGHTYSAVITVCDESEGGNCPIFPGLTHRLHLPFPDPSKLEGTDEEKLAKVREIRDGIKNLMKDFVAWYENPDKGKLGGRWEIKDIAKTSDA